MNNKSFLEAFPASVPGVSFHPDYYMVHSLVTIRKGTKSAEQAKVLLLDSLIQQIFMEPSTFNSAGDCVKSQISS